MPKIYAVTIEGTDNKRLVRAHTRAGAERFVRDSIKPKVSADVACQETLIYAMRAGVLIESAIDSPQADIGDVPQTDKETQE